MINALSMSKFWHVVITIQSSQEPRAVGRWYYYSVFIPILQWTERGSVTCPGSHSNWLSWDLTRWSGPRACALLNQCFSLIQTLCSEPCVTAFYCPHTASSFVASLVYFLQSILTCSESWYSVCQQWLGEALDVIQKKQVKFCLCVLYVLLLLPLTVFFLMMQLSLFSERKKFFCKCYWSIRVNVPDKIELLFLHLTIIWIRFLCSVMCLQSTSQFNVLVGYVDFLVSC